MQLRTLFHCIGVCAGIQRFWTNVLKNLNQLFRPCCLCVPTIMYSQTISEGTWTVSGTEDKSDSQPFAGQTQPLLSYEKIQKKYSRLLQKRTNDGSLLW